MSLTLIARDGLPVLLNYFFKKENLPTCSIPFLLDF